MLEEVTALSDKLHLETKDFVRDKQEAHNLGVTRIPGFVLQGRCHTYASVWPLPLRWFVRSRVCFPRAHSGLPHVAHLGRSSSGPSLQSSLSPTCTTS